MSAQLDALELGTKAAKIRLQRRVLKALYLVQTGAVAGLIKFQPVYFAQHLGLSATRIGFTLVCGSLANFAGGIWWGRAADVTGKYKIVMAATNACSMCLVFTLMVDQVTKVFVIFVMDFVLIQFFGSCWGTLVDAVAVIGDGQGEGSYGRLRLWAAVGWGGFAVLTGYIVDLTSLESIFVVYAAGMVLSTFLLLGYFSDPVTRQRQKVETPGQSPQPPDGYQDAEAGGQEGAARVGAQDAETSPPNAVVATVGYERLDGPLQGGEAPQTGADGEPLPPSPLAPSPSPPEERPLGLRRILGRFEVMLLLLNLLVQGVLVGFVETFLYVYLARVYHCPAYFMGLCTATAALFELPIFYYADWLLATLGVRGLLTVAQVLYATRVWAYTYIPNNPSALGWWLFLATEPSHAFVFAAMWTAAVEYGRRLAPPEHQGTMQALVRGTYFCLGNGSGGIVGGLLIDSRGGGADGFKWMYRVGGVAMLLWSCVWHVLMRLDEAACRRGRGKVKEKENGNDEQLSSPLLTDIHGPADCVGVAPE